MARIKKKILFAAFEASPFIKTGGLGDVAGSLPASIKSRDYDIRVILPKLSAIPEEYQEKMKLIKEYKVQLAWRRQDCELYEMEHNGVTFYFIGNDYYFKRDRVYGEYDDAERVAFFSMAVLETIGHSQFKPNIIHCNDWHTAMIPVFLHEMYNGLKDYKDIKTIMTIHNLKFQGMFDKNIMGDILDLCGTSAEHQILKDDCVNMMQGAVIYSDKVTTVSPTYAENICTPEFGEGLDGLFNEIGDKLLGIVNGLDYNDFDPLHDEALVSNFVADTLKKKKANKKALQKELGLPQKPGVPLFAIVSRLTPQKGMDLVVNLLPEFAKLNMQLAVLGTGDKEFEKAFTAFAEEHPDKVAVRIAFNESLSRKFYAGADCFMMPSVFEPCGLAQMMAMRYGTLPLVRETGGLKDTVKGYWDYGKGATGFSFKDADENAIKVTVELALDLWKNEHEVWEKLQKNAMAKNFSWPKSAKIYRKMYRDLIK